MAELDAMAVVPGARRKWPLAGVIWIDLVIVVVLVLVSSLAVQALFIGIGAAQQGIDLSEIGSLGGADLIGLVGIRGVFISTLLQNLICVLVPLIRIGLVRREPLSTLGFTTQNWLRNIGIGLGIGVIALGLNVVLSLFFSQVLGMEQDQSAQFGQLLRPGDIFGQALFAIIAIVLAPIGEETLFRGYIFNGLRQGGGNGRLVLAYVVSAGLFSAVHLLNVTQGQLALVVPIFVVGLVLAAAMHLTGSIIPGIIAHAFNNSLGIIALLTCTNLNLPGCPV